MRPFDEARLAFFESRALVPPPVTVDEVTRGETLLQVKLPREYVELLMVQNGGPVSDAYRRFTLPAGAPSWADDWLELRHLNGIGSPDGSFGDILDSPQLLEEWEMPEGLVLLDGDGHTWFALDYRAAGPAEEPAVVWYDNDERDCYRLAASFGEFINALSGLS